MRLTVVVFLLLCGIKSVFAQQESNTIRFEPYLGFSISNLTKAKMDSEVGLATGVNIQYQCDNLGVVTGLGYSNYGAKNGNASLTLGYIELPILAKYYIYKGLALSSGIQMGLNICDGRTDILLPSDANKFAFGIPVGISYDFKHLILNAQYYFGLTKVYKDFEYQNRGAKITIGYKI